MIEIIIANNGKHVMVDEGITLLQLKECADIESEKQIVGATINNVPFSLCSKIYANRTIRFLDIKESAGNLIYMNSLVMVLNKAISEVLPKSKLRVEHSISDGYFCRLKDETQPDEATISKLKAKMSEIIAADMPITPIVAPTTDAVKMFAKSGQTDISDILKYRKNFYCTYFNLCGTSDFYLSGIVPSTGYLKKFDLQPYYDGMLLQGVHPLILMPKLYQTYKNNWSLEQKARLTNIADINSIKNDDLKTLINITEALHEKNIVRISDKITSNPKIRVVLIAGPSSSGKTTFSKRLSVQLAASGVKPVALSLDNYFINRESTPLDENGEHDFETIYALDLERFYSDLQKIINGEEVETPVYNFETGERNAKGIKIKLDKSEVLIIEGIHALNPLLLKGLPQDVLFKILVSALNTLSFNDHNCIQADDTRLLRRIVRDYKYRTYSAEATILRWPSVRRGEKKWIEPFQENADEMFNSSLLFELAAIRRQAEPMLREVPHYSDAYPVAYRLIKLLGFIKPIPFGNIPATSLLREFLGGSGFKY